VSVAVAAHLWGTAFRALSGVSGETITATDLQIKCSRGSCKFGIGEDLEFIKPLIRNLICHHSEVDTEVLIRILKNLN